MEKFELKGFYSYPDGTPNGRGDLSGELEIDSMGVFEAEIYDHASKVPKQIIKGHLKSEEGLIKLLFLKFPPASNLANLAYSLQKENNGEIEGEYNGQWGALPIKVEFDENYKLFIARIDLDECCIGDKAQITLSKKA